MSQDAPCILIAMDGHADRLSLRSTLERLGFRVAEAEDGADALRQFRAQPWDLVMLDARMPGLDGFQVCAQLRREAGHELPIVMAAGVDDPESIELAFQAGATDFMPKPINWALIGHHLRFLLRGHQVQRDQRAVGQRNAAILNAIPDVLLRLNVQGRVSAAHLAPEMPRHPRLPGPGELLAQSLPETVAGELLAATLQACASAETVTLTITLTSADDADHHYEARLARIAEDEAICLLRDITERKLAEAALRQSESLLRQAQSVARMGSWYLDLASNSLEWSPETYHIFGIPEGTCLTYDVFLGRVHPDDVAALDQAWHAALAGAPYHFEHRILVGDEVRWVLERADLEVDAQGRLLAGVGTVQDITERKLQELEIVATRNKLRDTLEAVPDLMFEVDLEGRYLDVHAHGKDLLAAPPEQLLGRTVTEILPPEAAATCMEALHEANERGSSLGRQILLPLPAGGKWFELSVSRKTGGSGQPPHFIVLSRDITERKEAEHSVYRLAYFDPLTGLPNRLSFLERIEREIMRAQHHGDKLAVLFLDLDGFKNINDTLGHGAGDLLLQWAADRLRQSVRPLDLVARADHPDPEADLARLGGDEFTLLIPQLRHPEHALGLAHRIHEQMRRPFVLEGREVVVTTSIGIALFPDDGEDAATLLKHADTAMYHAKDQGRDNCQFYSASLTREAMRRLNLESNLRLALEREEFFLVYQPQLDLATGRIHSVEALIRWRHPEQGLIPPMEFIPAAEENGLIVPIGDWVLRTACQDACRWRAAGMPLRVAVNLSAMQFRQPGLVRRIQEILTQSDLPAEGLELEVTEGALMEESAATLATLQAMRQVGVRLSLDDFGTGYSSLSYLKRLPLNNLKVDQSFVRGLPADRESLAIVRAIVSLAKNLGFTVTAEGIETLEQASILHGLACETLQGYYISKPVPAEAIPALLARQWQVEQAA